MFEKVMKQFVDTDGELCEIVTNNSIGARCQNYYGVQYNADGSKSNHSWSGMFDSLEEAEAMMHKHRPFAKELVK